MFHCSYFANNASWARQAPPTSSASERARRTSSTKPGSASRNGGAPVTNPSVGCVSCVHSPRQNGTVKNVRCDGSTTQRLCSTISTRS